MLLLIDENVPRQVAEVFRERGHEVRFVTEELAAGTADPVIAVYGNEVRAIIVTWNQKDFKKLAARVSEPGRRYLRGLGRISFRVFEPEGRKRAQEEIENIEALYAVALRRSDKRLLLEVTHTSLVIR